MGIFTMKQKKSSLFKVILSALILFGAGFGGYKVYDTFKETSLPFDLHGKAGSASEDVKTWVNFNHDENAFSAIFPKKPDHTSRELPIPRSDNTLPYHEYQSSEGALVASVSYTVLPDDWLKWGSSLVLKGALKVIVGEIKGAHLVGQSSNTFKSFPALDFEHYLGDFETAGTLVLVGNTLYKVEIAYPVQEKERAHRVLCQFVESFAPTK